MRFAVSFIVCLSLNLPDAGLEPVQAPGVTAAASRDKDPIERGFDLLYSLEFPEARDRFTSWQETHPDDPLGPAAVAASYLFEEFFHQGVLTSAYFLDDRRLLGGIGGKPDEKRKRSFVEANQRARSLALRMLEPDPNNADALFAMTLVTGMQADFESILVKRQMESLRLIKEANGYANRLLALRPGTADAWLALGAANYIIGCLPLHVRFLLWFGGIHGDRNLGMEQLKKAAEDGHFLKPFAKILLALAALRERQKDLARKELSDLVAEFPRNSLFAAELARLH